MSTTTTPTATATSTATAPRATTTRTCLIATTPRSGSWLLSDTLHATGCCGEPQEYFEAVTYPSWSRDVGMRPGGDYTDFVRAVLAYSTGPNGVASAKLHWSQFMTLTTRLRAAPGQAPATHVALIDRFFPDVHYVHLIRRDKARQAISYFRASALQRWWDLEGAPPADDDLEPDFRQIGWMEQMLVDHEGRWRAHLARHGRPVLELAYEDIVDDRPGAARAVLDLLGVEVPDDLVLPEPRVRKQRDARTEEWLVAYEAVRDGLEPLPRPYRWSPEIRGIVPAGPVRTTRMRRPGHPAGPPTADREPLPSPLPWSFLHIVDEHGRDTRFGVLRSPIGGDEVNLLHNLARGRRMLGWMSYGPFPTLHPYFDGRDAMKRTRPGWTRPNLRTLDGWVHCMREPGAELPPDRPRALISESDFTDPVETREIGLGRRTRRKKRWDVIYICLDTKFARRCKNWELGKRCITALVEELGATALLVGPADMKDAPDLPGVDLVGEIDFGKLLRSMARSRLMLLPNELDASPRIITEATCLDTPIVVNRNIVGGWKYVNDTTGRLFTDEHDVVDAVRSCLAASEAGELHPYEWFAANYGPERSGRRLAEFLREVWDADAARRPRTLLPMPRPTARAAFPVEELGA